MARRRARKTKRTTRRRPRFNVLNAAQTYLQTAIITQAAFRATPIEFVTGNQNLLRTKYSTVGGKVIESGTYTTSGYQPIANGTSLTLPELFGMNKESGFAIGAGGYSQFGNGGLNAMSEAVKENIRLNGGLMTPVVQTVALNVGFTVGKRIFRKQLSGVRKGLKMAGLSKDVTV